ncbi:carboxymuconolactone decarboxylase family protein [Plastorhodobacter daqingensis]|uniref:Carboxymuconolactone decarboxylase family protein n=1 Tax=Plastorhodobacter daqingensis TaxID=1387281 RepID=A0ABW2UJU0_9RHOB
MNDENFQKGLDLRRAMWGKEGAEDHIDNATEFMAPVQDIVTRICFGEIWQRPHLDPRTRSLITLAMLAAQGRTHEIKIHTRGAVANGISRDELKELFIHAFPYCGLPLMIDGIRACEDALAEMNGKAGAGDGH